MPSISKGNPRGRITVAPAGAMRKGFELLLEDPSGLVDQVVTDCRDFRVTHRDDCRLQIAAVDGAGFTLLIEVLAEGWLLGSSVLEAASLSDEVWSALPKGGPRQLGPAQLCFVAPRLAGRALVGLERISGRVRAYEYSVVLADPPVIVLHERQIGCIRAGGEPEAEGPELSSAEVSALLGPESRGAE